MEMDSLPHVIQGQSIGFKQSGSLSALAPSHLCEAIIRAASPDFYWDGFHWVPQAVLFLSRNEPGTLEALALKQRSLLLRWSRGQAQPLHRRFP